MGPLFVRRGEVVFLLPNPTIFLSSLKAGRILPTDHLLVKNDASFEWVPISDVDCFDMGGNAAFKSTKEAAAADRRNMLSHIRVPRFNFNAFLFGGAWYLKNNMPRRGLRKLLLLISLLSLTISISITFSLGSVNTVALTTIAWLTLAFLSGLNANRDFNRMLVKNFHHEAAEKVIFRKKAEPLTDPDMPNDESAIFIAPTWRERVWN
ncbi:hypothetical protein KJ564_00315 [bacterium]|nr:hypothetical protein [bacterium]MBU1880511.1 hypothetical protein [bacterium]